MYLESKFIILFIFLFSYLVVNQSQIFCSVNYAEGLEIQSKPSTSQTKRLRLTDALANKTWKGEFGKNVLKIDLGEERKFNTVRFQVKEDITFTEIKLKAGTNTDNRIVIYTGSNKSALANQWITIKVPKTTARYISLILRNARPKIFELEVYCTQKDFNGDGYDDFMVGANEHDAGGGNNAERGRAYVYLGGSSLNSTPALTLSGDENGAAFGSSVSDIGDINRDGYDDFIVSAPNHDSIGINQGKVYVYLGGFSLNSTPVLTLSGDEDNARLGDSVSGIGDVNNDGYDDFMVGAPGHDAGLGGNADRGRAYVYFGGSSLNSTPTLTLSGDENSAFFGFSVSGIGDINRDGYDDFIVGAPDHEAGASGGFANRGRVYIYFGGPTFSDPTVLDGDENGAYLGWYLSGLGDVNNDDYDDFIVVAPVHDTGAGSGANLGRSYVYFGGPTLSDPIVLDGDEPNIASGWSVSSLGDVNHDSYDDFIISFDEHDAGAGNDADLGRAYVYFGGPTLSNPTVLDGDEYRAFFGRSASGIGDINGDRYDDFIISSPLHDMVGGSFDDRGRVYVYFGGSSLSEPSILDGDEDYSAFGYSVN